MNAPIRVISPLTLTGSIWKRFVERHLKGTVLEGLHITPQMVRTTVLQVADARDGFRRTVARAMGQHSDRVAPAYLDRPWMREALSRNIREFQSRMEAALCADISGVAARLGMTEEELLSKKALAMETGLGFLCLEGMEGEQPIPPGATRCDQVDACVGCRMRRFVPTETALVALCLFNMSLRRAESGFAQANPERWSAAWMPWLAMTEALIAHLRGGYHKRRFETSLAEAEAGLSAGRYALPSIW